MKLRSFGEHQDLAVSVRPAPHVGQCFSYMPESLSQKNDTVFCHVYRK